MTLTSNEFLNGKVIGEGFNSVYEKAEIFAMLAWAYRGTEPNTVIVTDMKYAGPPRSSQTPYVSDLSDVNTVAKIDWRYFTLTEPSSDAESDTSSSASYGLRIDSTSSQSMLQLKVYSHPSQTVFTPGEGYNGDYREFLSQMNFRIKSSTTGNDYQPTVPVPLEYKMSPYYTSALHNQGINGVFNICRKIVQFPRDSTGLLKEGLFSSSFRAGDQAVWIDVMQVPAAYNIVEIDDTVTLAFEHGVDFQYPTASASGSTGMSHHNINITDFMNNADTTPGLTSYRTNIWKVTESGLDIANDQENYFVPCQQNTFNKVLLNANAT